MMSAKLWATALTACALATSIALVGCSKDPKDAQQAAAAQQMPPTEVGVVVAQPQSVEQTVELSGRTSAFEISEVRPQTSGVILKRLFVEGSYVHEGQALYQLDARTNRADLENAKAALNRQQANLNMLRVTENRYRQLVSSNAISKQEYDNAVTQVKLAEADVESSKASVRNADINLGYSTIRAPISGQTNRSAVTVGALVTANQADPLVTIQRLNPIYVDINQSSAELLRLRKQLQQGSIDNSNNPTVKLKLEDGSYYPLEGRLAFSNASVNEDTGTILLRATFNNANSELLPGMFVNAQIVQGIIPNAFLIPQAALTRTPTGEATAMIVNAKGQVESRTVVTSGTQGQDWIVTQGLKAGDKVIVDGIAKVKPEQKVVVKPYQPKAVAPKATAPQSAQPAEAKPQQKATSNA
jgi:membrane fusion protein, multidrug efflux system